MNRNSRLLPLSGAVALLAFFGACSSPLPYDEAVSRLTGLVQRATVYEDYETRMGYTGDRSSTLTDTLPPIDQQYPISVYSTDTGALVLEVFTSTEKGGSGTDGWFREVAEEFNANRIRLSDGTVVQIALRNISSGTGYEYIASGQYLPHAFTPSNPLWIDMIAAAGVSTELIADRLVGNVAGIVMKDDVFSRLEESYGSVTIQNIVDATVRGELYMGYTNPFASSTGLNLLQTVLLSFAGGDPVLALTPETESAFAAFQEYVPFVALTTIQMRQSVEEDGSLDAFVMEYQTYANTQSLLRGYRFIPFGTRHDNPLYAIGAPDDRTREGLHLLADFSQRSDFQRRATDYGFNQLNEYRAEYASLSGASLIEAQRVWKENKDAGRSIMAVFLSDISGSMDGYRIMALREALIQGSQFISEDNYIGLVTFNDVITKILPIERFDERQQARFIAAVENKLLPGGATAMYDGIVTSLDMLIQARSQSPDARLMLFVLTDGETNTGLEFGSVRRVIDGLNIPVYSISYGEDITALRELSALNEAAALRANETDIAYQIGVLLNAEM